ncbi:GntR family transcriptional regulator [Nitratireductor sp. B36]|uniref:GntR family transcriptional regulator n=1 Tax=Nitratireductor sp. B36 TaxID=2762059 RepID=UPI001E50B08B|nr:GntR family transcriptional regulator [Nitratireductor sp. B36]MCC5781009.1 GntR family transcriptional regulator [Nitratireductor sp. B36]
MKARKIVRRSLHEEILEQIREMIVEGRWRPREILPEMQLTEELGVSRTPLREALKVLSAEGLLEVRPRSGAQIRVLSPEETRALFEAAGMIESSSARLAVDRATQAQIARIEELHRKMLVAYEKGRRADYFDLNQRIHMAIVGAAGNDVLSELHAGLLMRMRRVRFACTNRAEDWDLAIEEHADMLKALKEKDADQLASQLDHHMEKGWQRVREFVQDEYEQSQNAAVASSALD